MSTRKFLEKVSSRESNRFLSRSTGQQSSSDSNPQAGTTDRQQQQLSPPLSATRTSSQNSTTPPNNDRHDTAGTKSESKSGLMATAYSGTKVVFEVIQNSTDVFVPLKSIVGGLTALLKHYDQFIANKDDVRRLITRANSLLNSINGPLQDDDFKEIERRTHLKSNMEKVLETLDPMLKQSNVSGFFKNVDQAAIITSLIEDIRDAIMDYQTSLQQELSESAFALLALSRESQESTDILLLDKLRRSPDAGHLSGNRQKCLRGTRIKVLETIENWVHQNRKHQIYWLNGVAGCGKTTISQSLAERMFAEGFLGASFFCSRDFPDRRNLHFIFPTLAFQLAYKYPVFRAHLLKTIKSTPDIGRGSLENQLKMLLVEPLRSTELSTIIIIDALDECDDNEPASAILTLLAREIEHIPLVKFFITGRPEPHIRSGFRLPTLLPQTEVLLLHEVKHQDVDGDIKTFLQYHLTALAKNRSDIDLTTPWPAPEDVQTVVSKAAGLFIYASTVIKFLSSIYHKPRERLHLITSMPNSSIHEGQSGIDPLYTCLLGNSYSQVHTSDSQFFSRLLLVVSSVVLLCQPIPLVSLARLLNLDSGDISMSLRSLHSVLLIPDSHSKPIRVFHKSFPDYLTDNRRCKNPRFFVNPPLHHATLAICCLELMTVELKDNICHLPQYAMNDDIEDLSTRRQNFISEALEYACRFWAKHVCSTSSTSGKFTQIIELLNRFIQCHILQWLEVASIAKDLRGTVHSLIDVERWLLKVEISDGGLVKSIRECRRFILYSFDAIEQSATHIYHSALVWSPTSSLVRTFYQDQLMTQAKVLNGIDTSLDACIRSIPVGDKTRVRSVAFSRRGDLIAGCNGSVVQIFETATGVCLATLDEHKGDVESVTFSPDDALLASGSNDSIIMVWDVQTGAMVKGLVGHKQCIRSVAISPTGIMIASGADDKTVRVWRLPSGECDHVLEGHSDWVQSVCWLGTNKVVSGCDDGKVKVWDASSGECLKTFDGHSSYVRSVASSPDNSKIASGSDDKTIRVYDATIDVVALTILADDTVRSVYFSSDGGKIIYATDASVVVWDLAKERATFTWWSGSRSMAFSPDGSCVAVGSWSGFVKIIQVGITDQVRNRFGRYSDKILSIAIAADGQTIASGSENMVVKIWDAMTGSCMQTFSGHSDSIQSVEFSPDSSLVASGSYDNTVRIWSVHPSSVITDPCLQISQGHSDWINSVTFSPDSSMVVSGSDDETVRIWCLDDSDPIRTLKGHNHPVESARFSPDGRQIVSVSRLQEIILWDAEKAERLSIMSESLKIELDPRISFSADGARVILQFGEVVKRWNICANVCHSSKSTGDSRKDTSLPMVLVPVAHEDHPTLYNDLPSYRCSTRSEWILDELNRRVCWIPTDWRGYSDSHDKKIIIMTTRGRFVVLDFPDVGPCVPVDSNNSIL